MSYSNDLSSSEITSQILLLKDNCNSSYEALYPYGLSVEFPSESEEFLDDLIGYLNAIDKSSMFFFKYSYAFKTISGL